MDAAVLIPVKDFRQAKARLGTAISPDQRHRLARWSAQRVVLAAAPLPVFIACDDPAVAHWARELGASVLWRPTVGLNAAVANGIRTLEKRGFDSVIVAHSDLPLATALANLAIAATVVLVPDARRDGTNVMVLPSTCGLVPTYGPQSFLRHHAQALALGLPVRIVDDSALALDIDTPADLLHPLIAKELPPWLQMNLDNPDSINPTGPAT